MKEVMRPRAIQSPLSKSTRMSRIGSMAAQLERFFMSGAFSCLSAVPALFDRPPPTPQQPYASEAIVQFSRLPMC